MTMGKKRKNPLQVIEWENEWGTWMIQHGLCLTHIVISLNWKPIDQNRRLCKGVTMGTKGETKFNSIQDLDFS